MLLSNQLVRLLSNQLVRPSGLLVSTSNMSDQTTNPRMNLFCAVVSADRDAVSSTKSPPVLEGYQLPPKEIADIVNEPVQPGVSISPNRRKVLQMYWPGVLLCWKQAVQCY